MVTIPYPFGSGNPASLFGRFSLVNETRLYGKGYDAGTYGRTVPLSQGKRVCAGAPIWGSTVRTETTFFSVGAGPLSASEGSGYGAYTMGTDRTYTRDFAVALGYALAPTDEYPEPKLLRLWIDGVLAHDARNPDSTGNIPGLDFTFYTGTEDQLPDPLMVQDAIDRGLPADSVPAYRGMMYLMVRNFVVCSDKDSDLIPELGRTSDDARNQASILFQKEIRRQRPNLEQELVRIPNIRAEIADGHSAAISYEDFIELDDAARHDAGTAVIADWYNNEIITFSQNGVDTANRYITRWDTETLSMKSQVLITGNITGVPYTSIDGTTGINTFQCVAYDNIGQLIFAEAGGGNSAPLVVISATTGAILGQLGLYSVALQPLDTDGNDPKVTGLDVVYYPYAPRGAVSYVQDGTSTSKSVFLFGGVFGSIATNYVAAIAPQLDGSTLLGNKPSGYIEVPDPVGVSMIAAIPTSLLTAKEKTPQDAVFVVGNGNTLVVVFVVARRTSGSLWQATIVHNVTFADCIPSGYEFSHMLVDEQGVVLLYSNGTTTHAQRREYQLVTGLSSFRGKAVSLNATPTWDVVIQSPAEGLNAGYNLSLANGNVVYFGNSSLQRLNTKSGETEDIYTYQTGDYFPASVVFNSNEDALYGANFAGSRRGLVKVHVSDASGWEAQTIGDYSRWMALRAGYPDAKITVDAGMTDLVIGCYMDAEYNFNTLFNDLGKLYDFSYFIGEGKIKFIKTRKNPVKATGSLNWMGNPSDGDTATIGTQTYRFKNTLALPFDVKIGATASATKSNFEKAVNLSGSAGTHYGVGTTISIWVVASQQDATHTLATAIHGGAGGNSITTASASAGLGWSHTTLTGGLDAETGDEITRDDMAPISEGGGKDNEVLVTTLGQMSEVPNKVQVYFFDIGKTYEYSNTTITGDQETQTQAATAADELRTPLVMTDSEANQRASKYNFRSAEATMGQEFRLPWRYMAFEPTDVVSVILGPYRYVIKLDEVTLNGDLSLSIGGANFATSDNITIPDLPTPPTDQGGVPDGDSYPVPIDGPLFVNGLDYNTIVLHSGVRSFGQAQFGISSFNYEEKDNSTSPVNAYNTKETIPAGLTTMVLPNTTAPWCTDMVTELIVAVRSIKETDLQSVSYDDYLAGVNMAVVGKPGRWEYIYFQNVEWVSSSAVKLTNIARGRRGTEGNVGNHQSGDDFYLVAANGSTFVNGIHDISFDQDKAETDYRFSAVGYPRSRPTSLVEITLHGYSLYPWAPTNVTAELVAADGVELNWLRRDRLSSNDWVTEDTELNEASEEYELEILSGTTVVRTVTALTSPTYTYSAANQVTDGFTTPMTSIKVRIYQVGALGRGFKKEITVDVS